MQLHPCVPRLIRAAFLGTAILFSAGSPNAVGQTPAPPPDATDVADKDAQPKDGPNSIGMEFVTVVPTSFVMGFTPEESVCVEVEYAAGPIDHCDSDDAPPTRINLTQGFVIQTTEVTQEQWKAVMGSNPPKASPCGADCPAERVTWYEVVAYANALSEKEGLPPAYIVETKQVTLKSKFGSETKTLRRVRWNRSANGYRLPTDAEWEFAARAGQRLTHAGSNDANAVGWFHENSGDKLHKVGQKRPNAWGLFDMSGNVSEWCWGGSRKEAASSSKPTESVEEWDKPRGVARGGGYSDYSNNVKVAHVRSRHPEGFRLVRNVD